MKFLHKDHEPICLNYVTSDQDAHLSVDVAAYLERRLELEEDGLREEDLARLEAQTPDLVLRQLNILARPRSTNCKKYGMLNL